MLRMKNAADFTGIKAWINSEPLALADLRGKVVLIDFWTYSCINCIRTLPYLKRWNEKYSKKGLVIVGVHTPEFSFEKKVKNVKEAVNDLNIKYPVAVDSEMETWRAYKNSYWPRKYLLDSQGIIRYDHIGEGGYEETEKKINELLSESGKISQEPKKSQILLTSELYAGYNYARKDLGNKKGLHPEQSLDYKEPVDIEEDVITLKGKWKSGFDNLRHAENKEGEIILKFTAKSVNIVAECRGSNSDPEIWIDNKPATNKKCR